MKESDSGRCILVCDSIQDAFRTVLAALKAARGRRDVLVGTIYDGPERDAIAEEKGRQQYGEMKAGPQYLFATTTDSR